MKGEQGALDAGREKSTALPEGLRAYSSH
jgi:hypothetical protein